MKKTNLKKALLSMSLFAAVLVFNPLVNAQNGSINKSENKGVKENSSKAKISNSSNVNLSTSPTLSEKDQEKMSRAAKADALNGKVENREITIIDHPTYPKYIVTGDAKRDEANYREAKSNWMRKNPEEYKKILNKNPAVKAEEVRKYRKTPQTN